MGKGGLEDVVAADSQVCFLDGKEGRLIYQGYDIHDLAAHSTFEEVVYLLWYGHLPNKADLEHINKELRINRALPDDVVKLMKQLPKNALPMEVLRTIVSMLSMYDPDMDNNERAASIRKATRLTAQIPTVIAYWDNIRNGKEPQKPLDDCNLATNFLYLLNGKKPDELSAKVLDLALILHADHELNASTFAARVAAATETDMHSAVTAAIGALKGPLHGGANQEVIKMLLQIGETKDAEPFIKKQLADHKKIMGFGHRVYKTEDPRAAHLRKMSEELGKRINEMKWYEMSRTIEEAVFREKGFYANVDFYSASVYYMLGIPIDLFTPIFAMSRISGWAAHILEQYANNRLIRPRAEYTGRTNLKYEAVENREALKS
ncbi:MAG: citrate synthase [Candidatus Obscuribacterales bacterium]|nr:citrate synthase [Candidatus Obscuribacterales bacterium]